MQGSTPGGSGNGRSPVIRGRDALKKLLQALNSRDEEEVYGIYLSMDCDLDSLAKAAGIPREDAEAAVQQAAQSLGAERLAVMEQDRKGMEEEPMPFNGLRHPDEDERERE